MSNPEENPGLPHRSRESAQRLGYERSTSFVRGGAIGIALVAIATAALVAAGALIAVIVTALY